MRKSSISFFGGVIATLLVVALTTTALAASGKITFSFANISLNGETKIVSGETITVANGQKVPGSILYVDEAGGKTNYLPIRAICDLLGVEIGYDSASRTVLLMTKTWQRSAEGKFIKYTSTKKDAKTESVPSWNLEWMPENVSFAELWHSKRGNVIERTYEGGDVRITYSYSHPSASSFMYQMQSSDSVQNYQKTTIQGYEADYYIDGDNRILVWEDADGYLFRVVARKLDEEQLFRVSESSTLCNETVDEHHLGWLPSGYTFYDSYATADTVNEQWVKDGVALSWLYSSYPFGEMSASAEEVSIQGEKAWYWDAELPFEDSTGTITVDGQEIEGPSAVAGGTSIIGVTIPGAKRMNTLVWQDSDTGIHFKIQSVLDRETMVRIACGVEQD